MKTAQKICAVLLKSNYKKQSAATNTIKAKVSIADVKPNLKSTDIASPLYINIVKYSDQFTA